MANIGDYESVYSLFLCWVWVGAEEVGLKSEARLLVLMIPKMFKLKLYDEMNRRERARKDMRIERQTGDETGMMLWVYPFVWVAGEISQACTMIGRHMDQICLGPDPNGYSPYKEIATARKVAIPTILYSASLANAPSLAHQPHPKHGWY
ncbi:hypothetical protein DL93DRAFT_2102728 [Clavulina sp. PMI_390]|nr:hypothetical protein DL93DRAFT_2102728 [Clavulina sp. PMI_390]